MKDDPITAQLIPLAWTPLGFAIGTGRQGVGIARAGLSQRLGRGTTVILAIASNLPDVDVTCLTGGPLAWLAIVTTVAAAVIGSPHPFRTPSLS